MKRIFQQLVGHLSGSVPKAISYEDAKRMARTGTDEERRRLAARSDIQPEILYFLAEDPSAAVRREIASNSATPPQADFLLAQDPDEEVRAGIAAKISRLLPGLTPEDQGRLHRLACQTMEILARDQMTRVRQILAETLKDVANAPPDVIRRLARDTEVVVAAPVLEFSPVLTDEDLIEIILNSPIRGALGAIARRKPVREKVADAIAASDDDGAIAELLGNPSAQVREETLDRLIDRAPEMPHWHAALVRRPRLSARATVRLAHFVADNLLAVLQSREDIDPTTLREVARVVRQRLDEDTERGATGAAAGRKAEDPSETPLQMAQRLHEADMLDETVILSALTAGDHPFVRAALAVRAAVPLKMVDKIIGTQSAKGVTALAWRARLPADMAVRLQSQLAHIVPAMVLQSRRGEYPLTPDEMDWQLEFFSDLATTRKNG